MKKIISTFLLILVMIFGLSLNVVAASGDVYNIVTCAGEDMSSQMQINWQSKTGLTDLKVEYTVATDTEFTSSKLADGVSREFSRPNNYNGANYEGFSNPRLVWNAELNELTPKTKYIYRIVKGDNIYSDIYHFETASTEDDEFTFLFMTDPQFYNETGASRFNMMTEKQITERDIKFAFITGDINDKGGKSSYWSMFFNKSSLSKVPFITTVGNHEYYDNGTTTTDNSVYNHFFFNPQNGPEHVKGSSYYFIYNDALFIMLDSEERNNLVEQQNWFRDVCKNTICSYIIVGTHKSCYAGAEYASDGKYFLEKWGAIFDECAVDLVLSGHDHMYARTKSIYADEVTTEKYKGTTYILGGSAGIKYYSKKNDTNLEKWDHYFDQTTCCVAITLGKEKLHIETLSMDNKILDEAKLDRKRFGEIDPTFTKEMFEASIKVENAMPDITSGKVSWSEKGYGLVKAVTATNLNSAVRLGSTSFINSSCTSIEVDGGFWIGEVNKIKVDILYADGTTKTLEFELDNNIDWGSFGTIKAVDVTSNSFVLSIESKLNKEVDYIDRIRVMEDGKVRKNFFLKAEDLEKDEFLIEIKNVLEPGETKTFQLQAMNVNGTIIWEQDLMVRGAPELTEEQIYQNSMANIAFKAMIDNLLKALGQE